MQHVRLITKQEDAQISKRHTELVEWKARASAKWNLMQEEMTVYRTEQQTWLYDLIQRANERKGYPVKSGNRRLHRCFVMGCFFLQHAGIRKEEELTKKNRLRRLWTKRKRQ